VCVVSNESTEIKCLVVSPVGLLDLWLTLCCCLLSLSPGTFSSFFHCPFSLIFNSTVRFHLFSLQFSVHIQIWHCINLTTIVSQMCISVTFSFGYHMQTSFLLFYPEFSSIRFSAITNSLN